MARVKINVRAKSLPQVCLFCDGPADRLVEVTVPLAKAALARYGKYTEVMVFPAPLCGRCESAPRPLAIIDVDVEAHGRENVGTYTLEGVGALFAAEYARLRAEEADEFERQLLAAPEPDPEPPPETGGFDWSAIKR